MCPSSAATNIFIHGSEEQGQLANEVRFLWGQNQALKEQLNLGFRGKHSRLIGKSFSIRSIATDIIFPVGCVSDKALSVNI